MLIIDATRSQCRHKLEELDKIEQVLNLDCCNFSIGKKNPFNGQMFDTIELPVIGNAETEAIHMKIKQLLQEYIDEGRKYLHSEIDCLNH